MRNLVRSWVDIVLNDISSRGLLKSLREVDYVAMTAATRTVTLDSDTDQIDAVQWPSSLSDATLEKINDEQLRAYMAQDGFATQGPPRFYNVLNKTTIRLHPIPDSTSAPASPTQLQKLWVWKYHDITKVSDDTEISEIKPKHIPTVLYGAYSFGAKFDSILDSADATMKYEKGVARTFSDNSLDLDRAPQTQYQDV